MKLEKVTQNNHNICVCACTHYPDTKYNKKNSWDKCASYYVRLPFS